MKYAHFFILCIVKDVYAIYKMLPDQNVKDYPRNKSLK